MTHDTDDTLHAQSLDAVLFDLDGTLVEYAQDDEDVLAAAFERAGVEPFCTAADLEAVARGLPFEGRPHAAFWVEAFERAARRHGGDPAVARGLYEAYGAVFDRTQVRLVPGAAAALDASSDGFRVGLVTNGTRQVQEAKLASLDLGDAFETAVFAGEGVAKKPSPEPFAAALSALGVDAERACYVGDSFHHDVVGATRVGLRTVWYPGDGVRDGDPDAYDETPDAVCESLDELVGLLR